MSAPPRGFSDAEYEGRLDRAQALMAEADLAALLLTTEPEVRYFSGFLTRFWESPTRPWFLIVPAQKRPVAVIPSIGAPLMSQGWVADIRTWRSPDYVDDGVGLLADALAELVPPGSRVGVPSGAETHLRLPLSNWVRLQGVLSGRVLGDDAGIMRRLRMIKSPAEVVKIARACAIAGRAFARVGEVAAPGVAQSEVFRRFQMLCLEEGADWVAYLAGGAGHGGYGDIIAPASDKPLASGDVLMLDTGVVWDGYFCDYDRNFAIGDPGTEAQSAHRLLVEATLAAAEVARPGARAADLFAAMDRVLGPGAQGASRLGHGLGMQLTEWPSLIAADDTVLEPGMVLTLEPGVEIAPGRGLVHEENIVITADGARFLTSPATADMPIL